MNIKRTPLVATLAFVLSLILLGVTSVALFADGSETLGPPANFTVAQGTGFVAGGAGFGISQPQTFQIDVPAGVTVKQVIAYWSGGAIGNVPGDSTITINGTGITGNLIGGPSFFFNSGGAFYFSSFRADITNQVPVTSGVNTFTVGGMAFGGEDDGVGILVIYDDGSGASDIQIVDGIDLAYLNFPEPRKTTVPQTFTFAPVGFDRLAHLVMFVGSVGLNRPTIITVTVNGVPINVPNVLATADDDQWDTVDLWIPVAAGASTMTVEIQSYDDPTNTLQPASLSWIGTGLSLPTATPAIIIEKATNGVDADTPTGPYIPVGDPVTWTYVVTNTGEVTLTNVIVTDDMGVQVDCNQQTVLGPGASMTCTGTGIAQAGQYANVGSVEGTPPLGAPVTDTDPSHYYGEQPTIVIEKATNGEDADTPTGPIVDVGSTVTWTYVVTNTGNVDLTNVTVTDDQGVAVTCPKTTLAVGESMTCTGTGIAVAGQYANIGSVEGTSPSGAKVTDTDPSHYFAPAPAIVIEKATNGEDADTPTGPLVLVGNPVVWTYIVTNTGNVPLSNITVTDDNGTPGDTSDDFNPDPVLVGGFNQGDLNTDGLLDPGEGWLYTRTLSQSAVVGQYGNIAGVVGTPPSGPNVTDDDPSHYFGAQPDIVIEKATNGEDADTPTGPIVDVGSTVTWTYVVTNTGNVALTEVTVTDDQGVTVTCPKTTLAVGESMTCTGTGIAQAGQYANLGSVSGLPPTGPRVTDDDPSHYFGGGNVIVGDKVWFDANVDGKQDPGEDGVPGVNVYLFPAGALPTSTPVMTDTTDANGMYLFENLPPGDYYVVFDLATLPAGFVPSIQNAPGVDDALDSDADRSTGQTHNTGSLGLGDEDRTLDMGIYRFGIDLTKRVEKEEYFVGEEVTFTVRITNASQSTVVSLPMTDTFDSTYLEPLRAVPAWDHSDPNFNPPTQLLTWNDLTTHFGDLAPGQGVSIDVVFKAITVTDITVNEAFTGGAADAVGTPVGESNDNAKVTIKTTPTAVTLGAFAAVRQSDGVLVTWTTLAELNTWGFNLFRSTDTDRQNAVQVNDSLILAKGQGANGASYQYLDAGADSGTAYHYWLQEVGEDGQEFGPVAVSDSSGDGPSSGTNSHMIFLPIAIR